MELEDPSAAAASEEDLLFAEDGTEAAEYTTGEVDQLLFDEEDSEKYLEEAGEGHEGYEGHEGFEEEGHEGEAEQEGEDGGEEEGEGDAEDGDATSSARGGYGLRRPFMRGMRGGRYMMRGMMMMPPRFFPPMPPGMRPPPFPMFMGRPPFMMRGMRPMRLPMPPPFMRFPGMYPRFGPPRGRGDAKPVETTTEEESKSDGPKPLMSIPTPEPVKALMDAQHQHMRGRGLGMGMGPRYHSMRGGVISTVSTGRGLSLTTRPPLKRPAPSNGIQPMQIDHRDHRDHGEPRAKVPARSNLTLIQTVDEPMHHSSAHRSTQQYQRPSRGSFTSHATYPSATQQQHYPASASHYAPTSHFTASSTYAATSAPPSRFVVSHKPAPNLTQIPLTPSPAETSSPIRTVQAVRGIRVMIWNLPPSSNFAEVSAMTTSCGSVRTLNVRKENNTAIIEFSNSQSADHFVRLYNNTVMVGCLLTVSRI